ncbi:hypothetical protein KA107_00485 [Candidatus Pacearchaeota archaeon]|nr:hypothetical protein [Candidatus Pacearchaeota archaeon]
MTNENLEQKFEETPEKFKERCIQFLRGAYQDCPAAAYVGFASYLPETSGEVGKPVEKIEVFNNQYSIDPREDLVNQFTSTRTGDLVAFIVEGLDYVRSQRRKIVRAEYLVRGKKRPMSTENEIQSDIGKDWSGSRYENYTSARDLCITPTSNGDMKVQFERYGTYPGGGI